MNVGTSGAEIGAAFGGNKVSYASIANSMSSEVSHVTEEYGMVC